MNKIKFYSLLMETSLFIKTYFICPTIIEICLLIIGSFETLFIVLFKK